MSEWMFKLKGAKESHNKKLGLSLRGSNASYVIVSDSNKKFTIHHQEQVPISELEAMLRKVSQNMPKAACYISIPHRDVIVKNLFFNGSIKESDVDELIRLNAEEYFSYPIDAICYDYELIKPARNKVRIIASKKESIGCLEQLFRENTLNIKAISVDVLALENYLIANNYLKKGKRYGVFLTLENEMLQVVIGDGCLSFMTTSALPPLPDPVCYLQEIHSFLRRYEESKSFSAPITDILFLSDAGSQIDMIREKMAIPVQCIHANGNFALPLGMVS